MGGVISNRLTRRALLAQGFAALATAAAAEAPLTALRPEARPGAEPPGRPDKRLRARPSVEEFVTDARLGGNVAYVLADARTGRVLQSREADVPLPPASVAKSLTALYALDALGGDHRFRTRILVTAPVVDGITEGDLILAGGGDPVLDTDGLADLALRMKETGLREVRGRFLVWGGALPQLREIDPGQLDHLGYNPAISGLNLNFNRVHFQWTPEGGDYVVTMDARSASHRPEVRVARIRVEERDLPVYTYEDDGGFDNWTVARGALGSGGARWLPVRRPDLYAGEVFRVFARSNGIVLDAPERPETEPAGDEIAALDSPPLTEIVQGMLQFSTNMTAEVIGLAASRARGVAPSSLAASAAIMSDWLGLQFGVDARIVDHSGLGDASRISAADLVRIHARAGTEPTLRPLLRTVTLRDIEGRPLDDPPAQVLAKTGTLNFVSCLSGYLAGTAGRDLTFAILTANLDLREDAQESGDEIPPGASAWNGRSRRMQQRMLQFWGAIGPDQTEETADRQSSSEAGNPSLAEISQ